MVATPHPPGDATDPDPPGAPVEVSRPLVVHASRLRMALFIAGTLLAAAVCFVVAASVLPGAPTPSFVAFVSWVGFAFCLGAAGLMASRFLGAQKPTLRFAPEGFLDSRMLKEPVPWNAVIGLEGVVISGQSMLMVRIHPAYEEHLRPTRLGRLTLTANRRMNLHGVPVTVQALPLTIERVFELTAAWRQAYAGSN